MAYKNSPLKFEIPVLWPEYVNGKGATISSELRFKAHTPLFPNGRSILPEELSIAPQRHVIREEMPIDVVPSLPTRQSAVRSPR
ncbi:hypothetical protein AAHC03_027134 [Spirometra sp. Aus1]